MNDDIRIGGQKVPEPEKQSFFEQVGSKISSDIRNWFSRAKSFQLPNLEEVKKELKTTAEKVKSFAEPVVGTLGSLIVQLVMLARLPFIVKKDQINELDKDLTKFASSLAKDFLQGMISIKNKFKEKTKKEELGKTEESSENAKLSAQEELSPEEFEDLLEKLRKEPSTKVLDDLWNLEAEWIRKQAKHPPKKDES